MNTYQTLTLSNGQILKLTLNLKRLLLLKNNHSGLYREANKIITKGPEDIFDMVKLVYTAYLCALESGVSEIEEDAFLDLISNDFGVADITAIVNDLIQPKKK
ncbi:MAG: hypothetical protein IJV31_00070 [Clostridia bacterium]|nr:hypothetical protein [Clostridia bacterium]